jgi:hypothetical protein
VLAAAEDEVSAAIAAVFSAHGEGFQALGAQAAAFQEQFVQALSGAGGAYTAAEAANASPLQALPQPLETLWQDVRAVINLPTNLLLGTPYQFAHQLVVGDPVDRQGCQWGAGDRAGWRAGWAVVRSRR